MGFWAFALQIIIIMIMMMIATCFFFSVIYAAPFTLKKERQCKGIKKNTQIEHIWFTYKFKTQIKKLNKNRTVGFNSVGGLSVSCSVRNKCF